MDSKRKSSLKTNYPLSGKIRYSNKYVTLSETYFGTIYSDSGEDDFVKRFTWKNHNKITVSVITYGARIVSMKVPNRAGQPDDIVLGFDDIQGYLYYEDDYFGAIIGRSSNSIQNGTYVNDGKQHWLSQNKGAHHYNGGKKGFDKVLWTPHVNQNQLILSYMSPDNEEGYPGDLFVQITFELTTGNEFKIGITANTSQATLVDISNMVYFNLAGHDKCEELGKHVVLINSNCHTRYQENGFPTGDILNVVHTRFDFQTPKLLKTAMGLQYENGFDQTYCINRGVHQGDCFVARVTHPFSGRVLEIYSNQKAVNFYTSDHLSSGLEDIPSFSDASSTMSELLQCDQGVFLLVSKLQEHLANVARADVSTYNIMLHDITRKIMRYTKDLTEQPNEIEESASSVSEDISLVLMPLEYKILGAIKEAIPLITEDMNFMDIRKIIDEILLSDMETRDFDEGKQMEEEELDHDERADYAHEIIKKQIACMNKSQSHEESYGKRLKIKKDSLPKQIYRGKNVIPSFYTDGKIHGKDNCIYKRQGAFVFQTENYPNATYYKNFPSPIIKPNETYTHNITYKFWIQSGNPTKWLKRMNIDNPCNE